jgi:hypothetical protein
MAVEDILRFGLCEGISAPPAIMFGHSFPVGRAFAAAGLF